jgi:hypothetical protein
MARTRMDSHSRWDEVKAKRRPPSEEVRATVERELAEDERAGGLPTRVLTAPDHLTHTRLDF